jgi:ABC-type polysaccharide transport system permease subunit
VLFSADPAFVIYCFLTSLVFSVGLNQAFVKLSENVLLGFGLALVVALILLNVTLRSFVKTLQELFISPVFVGLFVSVHFAFFIDL